jgi:hypothetical protein
MHDAGGVCPPPKRRFGRRCEGWGLWRAAPVLAACASLAVDASRGRATRASLGLPRGGAAAGRAARVPPDCPAQLAPLGARGDFRRTVRCKSTRSPCGRRQNANAPAHPPLAAQSADATRTPAPEPRTTRAVARGSIGPPGYRGTARDRRLSGADRPARAKRRQQNANAPPTRNARPWAGRSRSGEEMYVVVVRRNMWPVRRGGSSTTGDAVRLRGYPGTAPVSGGRLSANTAPVFRAAQSGGDGTPSAAPRGARRGRPRCG